MSQIWLRKTSKLSKDLNHHSSFRLIRQLEYKLDLQEKMSMFSFELGLLQFPAVQLPKLLLTHKVDGLPKLSGPASIVGQDTSLLFSLIFLMAKRRACHISLVYSHPSSLIHICFNCTLNGMSVFRVKLPWSLYFQVKLSQLGFFFNFKISQLEYTVMAVLKDVQNNIY